ncbi:unnamed protein product [Arabidopsis halleri]
MPENPHRTNDISSNWTGHKVPRTTFNLSFIFLRHGIMPTTILGCLNM